MRLAGGPGISPLPLQDQTPLTTSLGLLRSLAVMPSFSDQVSQKKKPCPQGLQPCLRAELVKSLPAVQETPVQSWVGKTPWRRDRLLTTVFLGFPCGPAGKESARNAGDLGSIPGLERSPGEGKGYPLQYCGRENSMG